MNIPGKIRISNDTQDLFTHASELYLLFEGKLVKNADDTAYIDEDAISLINSALMFLFSNINYQLSGQEIESIFNPDQATTMFN